MTLFDLPEPAEKAPGTGELEGDADRVTAAGEQPVGSKDEEAGPRGPLRRVRLDVAYDGTGFHGFARQPRQRTVGGQIVEVLAKMTGMAVEIVCAGRTDAGVHALGQVLHADLPEEFLTRPRRVKGAPPGELGWLARSLSHQLGPEIAVSGAEMVPPSFDARHSAASRRYRYDVLNRQSPDPLLARTSWHVESPLELSSMRLACDVILGEHDFAAFCRRPGGTPAGTPLVRRISHAGWERHRQPVGLLRFEIEANAFCHHMVRSLVAALVAVGSGRLKAARIGEMLDSGDRTGAPALAPPGGLCLLAVRYPAADIGAEVVIAARTPRAAAPR